MRIAILTFPAMLSGLLGLSSIFCSGQATSAIRVTAISDSGVAILGAEVSVVGMPRLLGIRAPDGAVSFYNVPPGNYQLAATSPGFRNATVSEIVVTQGKTTELSIKLEHAPPKASDFRIYETLEDAHFYADRLTDLGESAFCSQPVPDHTERYRFLWVPTFEHPIFLRIDIDSKGVATLLTQVWNGHGGYEWGKPKKNARILTEDEDSELFETLADIGFWTLPSQVERPPNVIVLDGTQWAVEGVKDGKCHVVTRDSTPLTGLFQTQFLANVAKLKP